MVPRLIVEPKHYDSRVLRRWVRADIREVHVERNNGPAFANANRRDVSVFRPGKPFVEDGAHHVRSTSSRLDEHADCSQFGNDAAAFRQGDESLAPLLHLL